MKNFELAKIFYEIADYLGMKEEGFRPVAYRRAARNLESLKEKIEDIYNFGGLKGLEEIPGIGKNIALKIEEYLKTGDIKTRKRLKKETPINLAEISAVEGLGGKRAKVLFKELNIKNLKDLEKAAKAGKIAPIFGFGEKIEKNILQGIKFLKKSKGRVLLGYAEPIVEEILQKLSSLKEVEKINVAGSLRRKKETIGDADILVASFNPEVVMDFFTSMEEVVRVLSKGPTKSSVVLRQGIDADLRVVRPESFGAALQYFTGSKEHNIAIRRIAINKGLKLNEYGVFLGKKKIAGNTEEEVYKAIGLLYIPPELREDQGEVEVAPRSAQGKLSGLPELIDYGDIKGDLHCHSNWDGGNNSIEDIAVFAQKMGYEYVGIADHTKFLRIEKGLDERQLFKRNKEIDKLNKKFKIKILKGCEANILNNGSLDINDKSLGELDFVIAGVHSSFKMAKEEMTERIIRTMKNPNVDIISHPTGRLLQKREEYLIDFDRILRAAKEFNVVLEINCSPQRLDLKDINIKKAKEAGVKMIINTDAHQKEQLSFIDLGIAQARRGWAEKEDIINTQSLKGLLKHFH